MDRDAEAELAQLYEEQYVSILRKCLSTVDEKKRHLPLVEDCVQEAFAKAVECYDEIRDYENPAGWIAAVTIHRLNNELAKERRHIRIAPPLSPEELEFVAAPEGIDDFLHQADTREKLYKIYAAQSPDDKRIFEAYFCEDKSAAEISRDMGKTIETILSCIKRIRNKARKIRDAMFMIIRRILWSAVFQDMSTDSPMITLKVP